jgi:hypothetical protein
MMNMICHMIIENLLIVEEVEEEGEEMRMIYL